MIAKRFPNCRYSEDCVQEQGTDKNYRNYSDLTIGKDYRSVAVAMARTGMRSNCAVLDFLLHFFVKKKVEERKNNTHVDKPKSQKHCGFSKNPPLS